MDSNQAPESVQVEDEPPAYASAAPTVSTADNTSVSTDTDNENDDHEPSSYCSIQERSSRPVTPESTVSTLEEAFASSSSRIICAFGIHNGASCFYYAGEPSISWTYFPHTTNNSLIGISAATVKSFSISTPHCVALHSLGAGYFAYTSPTTGVCWRFLPISQKLRPTRRRDRKLRKGFDEIGRAHEKLKDWLYHNIVTPHDIMTAKVVFGPRASFVAWKMDSNEWIGNDLPSGLQSELESRLLRVKEAEAMPKQVALGAGTSWAVIWGDGSHSIDLDNSYSALSDKLKEIDEHGIKYISLSPSGPDYYARLEPTRQMHCISSQSLSRKIEHDWNASLLKWSRQTDSEIYVAQTGKGESSRRIISPHMEANAAIEKSAMEAEESRRIAEESAYLSIESSKKSISASKIAVAGTAIAVIAACTVM